MSVESISHDEAARLTPHLASGMRKVMKNVRQLDYIPGFGGLLPAVDIYAVGPISADELTADEAKAVWLFGLLLEQLLNHIGHRTHPLAN